MPNSRIWIVRPTGLPKKLRAPFWRGERAEHIIKRRLKQYAAEDAEKARRRKNKKRAKK